MTQQTQKTDPILSTLPTEPSDGPAWLAELRRSAADSLREHGFPDKKTEAWRFTPVRPVTSVPFEPASHEQARDTDLSWMDERLGDDGTWRLAVVDGRPRLDAAGEPPEGVTVTSLADALRDRPELVEPHLGKHVAHEHFAALNAAMFEDGVVVHVRGGAVVETPLHLVHAAVPGSEPTAAYPRILVVVGAGAQCRLVESHLVRGAGKHLTNEISEIVLGQGAIVDHVRIHEGVEDSFHIGALAVHQERDSRYASRVFTFGGTLFRLDLDVALDGEGAECALDGVYVAGATEHVDHHTRIDHRKPHCSSNEVYRGILDGKAHAVFDGTIVVERDSQHTDANQENRNLLLSDDAQVHTKPHLRIDADDVKCSHGATIGSIDEDSLFYLRSRGIGEEQARAILTFSFAREVVDRVPNEAIAHRVGGLILDRLPYGDHIRELL